MEGANLQGCNFEDPSGRLPSHLEGVNLKGACLENSNMAGVNLRVANLKDANLKNCNLRAAILAGADLEVRNCDILSIFDVPMILIIKHCKIGLFYFFSAATCLGVIYRRQTCVERI